MTNEGTIIWLLLIIIYLLLLKSLSAEAVMFLGVIFCMIFFTFAIFFLFSLPVPSIFDIIHLGNTDPYALNEFTIWELLGAVAPMYYLAAALAIGSFAFRKYNNKKYGVRVE